MIQKELSRIQKELKAPKGQYNNFGKYAYRSTEDILSAVKPILGECSLVVSDGLVELSTGVYVEANASLLLGDEIISSKGYARESMDTKGMSPAQMTGSASSYARKYALNGLFAIDDTKDDDATNTHGKGGTSSRPTMRNDNKQASKITPEQSVKITNLVKKLGLEGEKKTKALAFANSDKTTSERADEFIKTLEAMIGGKSMTPKEKSIEELVNTAMEKWEDERGYCETNLMILGKVNNLNDLKVKDIKDMIEKIKAGKMMPF